MAKPTHRDRTCPRDHQPLDAVTVAVRGPDVTVDRCPECGGVFLDKNELARLTGDVRLNTHLRDRAGVDSDSALLCPHCGGIMDLEHVAGAEVEVCLTCFGLWLDQGELEALEARENREDVGVDADKAEELDTAARARARSTKRSYNPLVHLDRALGEFVRRYL